MSNCPAQRISTDTELSETYSGTNPGVLPAAPNGPSDRDDKGKLLKTTISRIIANLKSSSIIPSSSGTAPTVFIQKQQALIKALQAEYCFYESRYIYALDKLFTAISSGYLSGTSENKVVVQSYLEKTKMLNRRLNDLTQIMNGITEHMLYTSNEIEEEIKQFNARIEAQKKN